MERYGTSLYLDSLGLIQGLGCRMSAFTFENISNQHSGLVVCHFEFLWSGLALVQHMWSHISGQSEVAFLQLVFKSFGEYSGRTTDFSICFMATSVWNPAVFINLARLQILSSSPEPPMSAQLCVNLHPESVTPHLRRSNCRKVVVFCWVETGIQGLTEMAIIQHLLYSSVVWKSPEVPSWVLCLRYVQIARCSA